MNVTQALERTWKWGSVELLSVCVLVSLITWWAQTYFRNQHTYRLAKQVKGPLALPIIGCSYRFLGNSTHIFNSMMSLFHEYDGTFRTFHGTGLVYGVSKPAHLEVLLNSPKAYAKMYLYRYAKVMSGEGLFTAPVPKWKRHRKIISPTFNQKILDGFVEIFSEQCTIMVDQMTQYSGKGVFDLFSVINKCTLDIICETAMGVKVNAQTTGSSVGHWVDRLLEIVFLRMFVLLYQFDGFYKYTSTYKTEQKYLEKFNSFIVNVVTSSRAAFEKKKLEIMDNPEAQIEEVSTRRRKPFLELLMDMSGTENALTDSEICDEVKTFVIAGSDTTASSASFIFMMLGMHPEVQAKVYEEVMDVIGPDRELHHDDLPLLKYTERTIKETLRLFPVGAFVVRDIHDGDIPLGDGIILANESSVVVGIMIAHKDPTNWPDPLRFDPDRFLPEECAKRHPYSYVPFSGGPRNCIGMKYAMMAMKVMTASLVRKFEFFTEYKSVADVHLKTNLVVRPKDDYKVSVRLRDYEFERLH